MARCQMRRVTDSHGQESFYERTRIQTQEDKTHSLTLQGTICNSAQCGVQAWARAPRATRHAQRAVKRGEGPKSKTNEAESNSAEPEDSQRSRIEGGRHGLTTPEVGQCERRPALATGFQVKFSIRLNSGG